MILNKKINSDQRNRNNYMKMCIYDENLNQNSNNNGHLLTSDECSNNTTVKGSNETGQYIDSLDTNEGNQYDCSNSNLANFNNYNTNFSTDFHLRKPPLEIINEIKSEYSHDSIVYKRPLSKQDNEYVFCSSKNRFYPSGITYDLNKIEEVGNQ